MNRHDDAAENSMVAQQALAPLLDELAQLLHQGDRSELDEFLRMHPSEAPQLRELLPTMRAMAEIGSGEEPLEARPAIDKNGAALIEGKPLGDFRIIRELGRGGMGTVFEAEQISMGRRVALKVLPFAAIANGKALQRFRNEVRAAAALDHPHIVSVYSVGDERGIHYYSMQLVRGQTVAELIWQTRAEFLSQTPPESSEAPSDAGPDSPGNENPTLDSSVAQPPSTQQDEQARISTAIDSRHDTGRYRTAARLGVQAAEGLQHAHDQGVLHRDIKPGNLMLDANGDLYITDFGLARIEADAGMTLTGDIIGTLRYMAPEQALAKRVVIDHRADIYSLGATLYELLTLQPAFASSDRQELLKQIAFDEPTPLCRIDPLISIDLETIVLKAMAKSPEERYSTSQELADDLQAYVDDRPIMARRPNLLEKVVKWSRRHQAAVIAAAVCLALVACVASAAAIAIESKRQEAEEQAQVAEVHRRKAIQQRDESYYHQYVAQIRQGQQDWESGKTSRLMQTLAEHLPNEGRADYRGWEWYYLLSLCDTAKHTFQVGDGYGSHVSVSPDGRYALTSGAVAKLWALPSWKLVREFRGHVGRVGQMCWSPDGKRIASAGKDRTLRIWDPLSGRQLHKFTGSNDIVPIVEWSPSGAWVATPADLTHVQLWNVASGEAGANLDYEGDVFSITWSPDGEKIAVVGGGGNPTRVWRAETGEPVATFPSKGDRFDVAWSPDGRWLANATYGAHAIQIWDAESGQLAATLKGHQAGVNCLAWSEDGSQLGSGGRDDLVIIWSAESWERTQTFRGHTSWVWSLDWTPDGKSLISGDGNGEIRVWSLLESGNGQYISVAIGDDNHDRGRVWTWTEDPTELLVVNRTSGEIATLDPASGGKATALEGNVGRVLACVWNFNGDRLATASADQAAIDVWRIDPERSVVHLATLQVGEGEQPMALSPDGRYLLTKHEEQDAVVWDVDGGRELFRVPTTNTRGAAWSPDSSVLAIAEEWTLLSLWEVPSGLHRKSLSAGRWKEPIAWRPDGEQLAAGGFRQRVDTWDVTSGNVVLALGVQQSRVDGVAWSPDGSRIASNADGQIRLWDAATGEEVFSINSNINGQLCWSPDGKRLAGTSGDGKTIVIYDAAIGYREADEIKRRVASVEAPAVRPESPIHWTTRADFLLENNRRQEYQELCRYLVALVKSFQFPEAIKALSTTCALGPNALDDYRVPIAAARRVSTENPQEAMLRVHLASLLYRSGDWEGAHRLLLAEQSNLKDAATGDQALAWCWLAMTEHRLNQDSDAKVSLERLLKVELDSLSSEVSGVISRLRDEAHALIAGGD